MYLISLETNIHLKKIDYYKMNKLLTSRVLYGIFQLQHVCQAPFPVPVAPWCGYAHHHHDSTQLLLVSGTHGQGIQMAVTHNVRTLFTNVFVLFVFKDGCHA